MKIEVKKLNALGKYTGNFQFDYIPPEKMCVIPLCEVEGNVKVTGSYEIYEDDSVSVVLTVKYVISGKCSYCLKDAKKNIEFTSEILFVTEEDDENYSYDGVNINLETAVRDAVLISQPSVLLCKEGCEGIDVTKKSSE